MKIFLDDVRNHSYVDHWITCRTADEAIDLIKTGKVTHISFDHDLGDGVKTGYDVACVIEDLYFNGFIPKIKWSVHSANPVGRANIVAAMTSAEENYNAANFE